MWWHCRCTGVRLMYTPVISIAVAFVLALVAPAHAGAPTDALKGHVDYRPHRKDGRWLVYDVIIEGMSLVANYRTQFNKIVQTEGYESLVLRLRAKETAEPAASPGRSRTDR